MDSVMNLSALPYPVLSHLIKILPPESIDNLSKCNKNLYNLCCSLRKKPIHTLCVLLKHRWQDVSIYIVVQDKMLKIEEFVSKQEWNESDFFPEYINREEVAFQYIAEFLKTRDVYETVHFAGDFSSELENGKETDILRYLVENKIAINAKNCEIYYSHLYEDSLLPFLKEHNFTKLIICHKDLHDQLNGMECIPSEVLRASATLTSFTSLYLELDERQIDLEEPLQRIDDEFANTLMEQRKRLEGRLLPGQHLEIKGIYFFPLEGGDSSFLEKMAKDSSNTPLTIEFTLHQYEDILYDSSYESLVEAEALKNGFTKMDNHDC